MSASTWKGGVFALFNMWSFAAISSTSPVAISGFAFWRLTTVPSTRDDEFAAHVLGFGVRFALRFLVENDLDDAGAVADVKEEQIAEVAAAMDPTHDGGVAVGVGGAEGAAVVCAF